MPYLLRWMSTGLPLALVVLGPGCTRPNPGFGADTDGGTGTGETGDTVDTQDADSDSISTTMTSSASMTTTSDSTSDTSVDTGDMNVCGDGVRAEDEECDDGDENADDRNCTTMCRHNKCGDGLPGPGQPCDDGNGDDTDACSNDCVPILCGNQMVDRDQGEECDFSAPAGDVACTPACTVNICHDGYHLGDEDCDDGNTNDDDECVDECKVASCGDGYLWMGMEACDDDNFDDTDACVACNLADCGDGYVFEGTEDCDPMAEDSYACSSNGFFAGEGACTPNCNLDLSSCTNCGDGEVNDENEECDTEKGAVLSCVNTDGWQGEGSLLCESCQLQPMGECCQTVGQPCDPFEGEDTCCGQCSEMTSLCVNG